MTFADLLGTLPDSTSIELVNAGEEALDEGRFTVRDLLGLKRFNEGGCERYGGLLDGERGGIARRTVVKVVAADKRLMLVWLNDLNAVDSKWRGNTVPLHDMSKYMSE